MIVNELSNPLKQLEKYELKVLNLFICHRAEASTSVLVVSIPSRAFFFILTLFIALRLVTFQMFIFFHLEMP